MCRKSIYLVFSLLVLVVAGNTNADLVAHWTLDEGSGTTIADVSGNGNDGTITSNPGFDDPTSIAAIAPAWTSPGRSQSPFG